MLKTLQKGLVFEISWRIPKFTHFLPSKYFCNEYNLKLSFDILNILLWKLKLLWKLENSLMNPMYSITLLHQLLTTWPIIFHLYLHPCPCTHTHKYWVLCKSFIISFFPKYFSIFLWHVRIARVPSSHLKISTVFP